MAQIREKKLKISGKTFQHIFENLKMENPTSLIGQLVVILRKARQLSHDTFYLILIFRVIYYFAVTISRKRRRCSRLGLNYDIFYEISYLGVIYYFAIRMSWKRRRLSCVESVTTISIKFWSLAWYITSLWFSTFYSIS